MPENANTLFFTNPATGVCFGQMAMSTPDEVKRAVSEMRAASPEWSHKPVKERVRILRKYQELIIDCMDEITGVINQDCGKSRQDAMIEVFMTVDMLDAALNRAPRWLRRYRVSPGLYFSKACYVEPRPYGVVAVISPWNYPFALAMPPVLGALLAGNTVVLKPSEVTGAVGLLMGKLLQRVPELAPYVRVVHGDGAVGAALVQEKLDYIFLTGSTPTGRKVAQAAAATLTPLACELGGKDAMIVLADADLPAAARWGVWGSFFNAGQTCMGVERVYVVEEVYDEFLRLTLAETAQIKMGYSSDVESEYYLGPISDPRQLRVIRRHLEDAHDKGAFVLTGGTVEDSFIAPTVLVDVNHDMLLMREETFGPLMPVMKVKDEQEAIRLANDCELGLGTSVWSRDLEHAWEVARQVEASSVIINDTITQFAVPLLPFGGIKQSGYGRTHGKEGVMQFTRPYTYVVGQAPLQWDLATIMRSPGNYKLGSAVLHLARGASLRQRMEPVGALTAAAVTAAAEKAATVDKKKLALGVFGLLGLAGLALSLVHGKK